MMPRSSPCDITLSSAEEADLRKPAAKYTLRYFQVQRAKMILYIAQGMRDDEIAPRLGDPHSALLPTRRARQVASFFTFINS